jgi:hypothetical protein
MVREITLEQELDLILGVEEPIEVEWSTSADPDPGSEGSPSSVDDVSDDDVVDEEY